MHSKDGILKFKREVIIIILIKNFKKEMKDFDSVLCGLSSVAPYWISNGKQRSSGFTKKKKRTQKKITILTTIFHFFLTLIIIDRFTVVSEHSNSLFQFVQQQ